MGVAPKGKNPKQRPRMKGNAGPLAGRPEFRHPRNKFDAVRAMAKRPAKRTKSLKSRLDADGKTRVTPARFFGLGKNVNTQHPPFRRVSLFLGWRFCRDACHRRQGLQDAVNPAFIHKILRFNPLSFRWLPQKKRLALIVAVTRTNNLV